MDELRVPLDADGFARRECPRCRAHFKVRWGPRDAPALAAAMSRRVPHLGLSQAAPAPERHCAYCGAVAAADAFFSPECQRHLDAEGARLEAELRQQRLLAWRREHAAARPAPPLAPPPDRGDDLVRIALPCCGEEHKVSDAWLGPIRCHLCGVAHLRAGPRDIGLELALLKQWAGEP